MPYQPFRATVETVHRLSPNFVRVIFGGDGLTDLGPAGPAYDQRLKLIFPTPGGRLPELTGGDEWFTSWRELPEDERGAMRTYSIRWLERADGTARLAVDFVLHLDPGASGPAAAWAHAARPGDELLIVGPDRADDSGTGIEFCPGPARTVRLFGDETAAPAIARILADLPAGAEGEAAIEVPTSADVLELAAPPGVRVRWLPRDGAAHGSLLGTALGCPGAGGAGATGVDRQAEESAGVPLVWETPRFSTSGEELPAQADGEMDAYYWIAGESGMVTDLRRHLVRTRGIPRAQVSFMGYWKHGVAMRG